MFTSVKVLILTSFIALFVIYSLPNENKTESDNFARDLSSTIFDYKMKNIYGRGLEELLNIKLEMSVK